MYSSNSAQQQLSEKSSTLREWLLSQQVPSTVCDALDHGNVSKEELITYTEQDLIDLSNLLNLNVIIRKRLINAIKAIPNAVSSIPQNKSIEKVFVAKEEKEQIDKFETMIKNVKKNITTTTNKLKQCNNHFINVKNEINKLYDDIQVMVEHARKQDLQKVEF